MGTSAEPAFRRWSSGRAIRRALAKSRQESRPVPPRQCRAVGSAVGLRRHKRRLHRSLYVVTTSAPQYSLSWHYTKRLHDQEESWRGRGTARPSRGCLSQGCQPVPRPSRTLLRPGAGAGGPGPQGRGGRAGGSVERLPVTRLPALSPPISHSTAAGGGREGPESRGADATATVARGAVQRDHRGAVVPSGQGQTLPSVPWATPRLRAGRSYRRTPAVQRENLTRADIEPP